MPTSKYIRSSDNVIYANTGGTFKKLGILSRDKTGKEIIIPIFKMNKKERRMIRNIDRKEKT